MNIGKKRRLEKAKYGREKRYQMRMLKKIFLKSEDKASVSRPNLKMYDDKRIRSMEIRRVRSRSRKLPKMEGRGFKSFELNISKNLHNTQLVERYLRLRASRTLEKSIKGYKGSGGSSTMIPEG